VTTQAAQLTAREELIVQHMAAGLNCKAIAAAMMISELTVRTHRRNLMRKLGVHHAAKVIALSAEKPAGRGAVLAADQMDQEHVANRSPPRKRVS
jgi:DNA-binding CsgD family transcriptional regulator